MTAVAPIRSARPPARAAGTAIAIAIGVVIGLLASRWAVPSAALLLLAPFVLVCAVMPVRYLPVVALLAVLLAPLDQVGSPTWLRHLPVGAVPLAAFAVRAPVLRPLPAVRALLAFSLAGWLVLSLALATHMDAQGRMRSLSWTLVMVICVAAVAAAPRRLPSRDRAELVVVGVLTLLALGAVVESRVLHANPIFGHLYAGGDSPILQKWSGGYRATTSLGHPLVNGLVFACGLVLAAGRALLDPPRRLPLAVAALCLAAGVLATASRASLAAAGLGLFLLLFSRASGRRVRMAKVGLVVLMATGAVLAVGALAARVASTEAEHSASDRLALPGLVVEAAQQTGITGAGPSLGADFIAREQLASSTGSVRLESAAAELIVGIGIPGAALFYLLIGAVAIRAIRSPAHAPAGAAIAAFAAASAAFNAFESHAKVLAFLGVLIILATAVPPAGEQAELDA